MVAVSYGWKTGNVVLHRQCPFDSLPRRVQQDGLAVTPPLPVQIFLLLASWFGCLVGAFARGVLPDRSKIAIQAIFCLSTFSREQVLKRPSVAGAKKLEIRQNTARKHPDQTAKPSKFELAVISLKVITQENFWVVVVMIGL